MTDQTHDHDKRDQVDIHGTGTLPANAHLYGAVMNLNAPPQFHKTEVKTEIVQVQGVYLYHTIRDYAFPQNAWPKGFNNGRMTPDNTGWPNKISDPAWIEGYTADTQEAIIPDPRTGPDLYTFAEYLFDVRAINSGFFSRQFSSPGSMEESEYPVHAELYLGDRRMNLFALCADYGTMPMNIPFRIRLIIKDSIYCDPTNANDPRIAIFVGNMRTLESRFEEGITRILHKMNVSGVEQSAPSQWLLPYLKNRAGKESRTRFATYTDAGMSSFIPKFATVHPVPSDWNDKK